MLGIFDAVTLHSAVLSDFRSVLEVLNAVRPAYIFNLAAQSSVGLSFAQPVETIDSIMHGTINVIEAMRFLKLEARYYNACSSECFGNTSPESPANETTPFRPRSPYGVGKAASFWATANYREPMACLPVPAFCSITSRRFARPVMSPRRSCAAPWTWPPGEHAPSNLAVLPSRVIGAGLPNLSTRWCVSSST